MEVHRRPGARRAAQRRPSRELIRAGNRFLAPSLPVKHQAPAKRGPVKPDDPQLGAALDGDDDSGDEP